MITSFDVFQHLPTGSDRVAASEIRRVLSAGGVALIRANAAGFAPRPAVGGTVYRLEELTDAIGSAGLCVRRTSYANCLPALAQELRGRLCPISDSAGFPSSHPAGGGLRIQIPRPWINRLMASLTWAEALAAGPLGFSLPFGHSTLVLAEKS